MWESGLFEVTCSEWEGDTVNLCHQSECEGHWWRTDEVVSSAGQIYDFVKLHVQYRWMSGACSLIYKANVSSCMCRAGCQCRAHKTQEIEVDWRVREMKVRMMNKGYQLNEIQK